MVGGIGILYFFTAAILKTIQKWLIGPKISSGNILILN